MQETFWVVWMNCVEVFQAVAVGNSRASTVTAGKTLFNECLRGENGFFPLIPMMQIWNDIILE